MKANVYLILLITILAYTGYSCKEEGHHSYPGDDDSVPGQVDNINAVSTPGGAIITYKLPKDKSLSYVKAVYEIQPGVIREAKSSFYKDTLLLVGFGDTLDYKVEIYSVGRNEKTSEPVTINVKPLLPPIKTVFETLTIDATFGGVNISYKNDSQADLAIFLLADTTGNDWFQLSDYYTSSLAGKFSVRGLDPNETNFAVYIRDRWNNKSDTLLKTLVPLYEEAISYQSFKLVSLASDKNKGQGKYVVANLFNGKILGAEDWYKSEDDTYPQWFTMEMSQKVIFSRMKLYQAIQYPYVSDWVKEFEIWGTNELVDDWDKWTLLGHFECIKPSGLPDPDYTAADLEYERSGGDYEFPEGLPAVRYMRFKVNINRGGGGKFYVLNELSFWGQIVEE
ncbi:MAG: DUF4959 domain-containing protein [Bacteroidales bacterium]|jgi:hypothetical protein|nr:DUF4959 domain-containing protein [Bacteroidales bacterium]